MKVLYKNNKIFVMVKIKKEAIKEILRGKNFALTVYAEGFGLFM
jgi:hypothetical protein